MWNNKRPQTDKAVLNKKKKNWRYHPPKPQTILQGYSNQNSIVLAQIHRPTEWNREPRNNPTHRWSVNLQQWRQEYTLKKRQSFQQVVLGKLNS